MTSCDHIWVRTLTDPWKSDGPRWRYRTEHYECELCGKTRTNEVWEKK